MLQAALLSTVLAQPLAANEPVDGIERGACLELKVDGISRPCSNDMRLSDDGKGTVDLITGFLGTSGPRKTVLNFVTAQRADMENSYGYALRVTAVRTMTYDEPASRITQPATGLCFMVKPNPTRAGARAVKQDIVIMCTAIVSDAGSPVKKFDWKFVY